MCININMNEFKFDPNNTEGSWPTAMVVDGGEIKKGPKMVATDIVDLYDTNINNPQDAQQLIYATDIWINGEGSGGGTCNVFGGYEGSEVGNITADSMDGGDGFSMIIMSDGTLWGSGNCFHGQLGIGRSDSEVLMFEQEASRSTNWWKVACGANFTLAIKTDGTLWGAGLETYGEMGFDGATRDQYIFQQIDYGEPSMICEDVACGYYHSVILLMFNDGGEPKELYVCGNNSYGQLGTGVFGDHENTFTGVNVQAETPPFEITKIACGHFHTAVIDSNRSLYTCGLNTYGALGNNSQNNQNVLIEEYIEKGQWIDVSCGQDHTLAISDYSEDHSSGTFWATGSNVYGQLGQGSTGNSLIFISPNDKLGNYEKVHCGAISSMVLTKYGDIYAAGDSSLGQVGLEDDGNLMDLTLVFDPLNTSVDYYLLACGFYHSLALRNSLPNPQYDGLVHTTGLNASGELAQGDLDPLYAFTPAYGILPIPGFVYVDEDTLTPGYGQYDTPFDSLKFCFEWLRNTCAVIEPEITIYLLSDVTITEETSLNHPYGYMITIESNDHTITTDRGVSIVLNGNNSVTMKNVIFEFDIELDDKYDDQGIWDLATDGLSTFKIDGDGYLWGSGNNSNGQLGIGSYNSTIYYFTLESRGDNDWHQVSASQYHTVALKKDGTMWGCGKNNVGQLGQDDQGDADLNEISFIQIGTDNDWAVVTGGTYYTIAIKTDGTLWATGYSQYGNAMGLDIVKEVYTLTQVGTDTNWKQIVCGANGYTMALKTNGTIWAAGNNYYGQFGLGTSGATALYDVFTQIGTDADWETLGSLDNYLAYSSMAIKTDGTMWASGVNTYGQLGFGAGFSSVTTIKQVGTDTDWKKCCVSGFHSMASKTNGELWGSGYNGTGGLGTGSSTGNFITHIKVGYATTYGDLTDWDKVVAGYYFSMAVTDLNYCFVTGNKTGGRLGYDYPSHLYRMTIIGGGLHIDDHLIYEISVTYNYPNTNDLINIRLDNNSSLKLDNAELLLPEVYAEVTTVVTDNIYIVSYTPKYSILFNKSVGVFEGVIPENVYFDMRSVADIQNLEYDITNWTAKNDSIIAITDEGIHSIDINNENSMVVLNDAQL